MARSPNEKKEKAHELYNSGMKLVEIASQLDCSAATIRTWKNRYKWDEDENETFQKKSETKRNVSKKKIKKKLSKEEAVADEVEQVIQNTDLTDKQQLFCVYYIRCFNATKAYQKAYECDYTTAMVNGSQLLRNTKVKDEIIRLKRERFNREFLSESDVFQKYMDIAFADITDFLEFGTEEVPVMAIYGPVKVKDPDTGEEKQLTKTVNTVHFKDSINVDGSILSEVKQGKDGASIKLADRMKERYRSMYTGVFFRRYILGLWAMAEGIIYDMFNADDHVTKEEQELYPTGKYISIDYGTQNATVFLMWEKSLSGKWCCTKEYYYSGRDKGRQKTDAEYAKDLKDFVGNKKIRAVIVDPSAASFIAELRKKGFTVIKAKNDVADGIRLVGTLLNQKRILFYACCKNTLKEFASYIWDAKAADRGEDRPVKQYDHAMDAVRYFCSTVLGNQVARIKSKQQLGFG